MDRPDFLRPALFPKRSECFSSGCKTVCGVRLYNLGMLFQIMQTAYWLALATAFGGVLFVAMAAPVIFRTVREANPLLPTVLSVNMEGQHGTLLAGTLMMQLLNQLWRVMIVCGAVLAICLVVQFFTIDLQGSNYIAALLRCGLFLGAVGVMIYDRLVVWPAVEKQRQTYLDHADEPEVANPARDEFDRLQQVSVTMLMLLIGALLGLVLFSVSILPRAHVTPVSMAPVHQNMDHLPLLESAAPPQEISVKASAAQIKCESIIGEVA